MASQGSSMASQGSNMARQGINMARQGSNMAMQGSNMAKPHTSKHLQPLAAVTAVERRAMPPRQPTTTSPLRMCKLLLVLLLVLLQEW
jgi:hypothetical protein